MIMDGRHAAQALSLDYARRLAVHVARLVRHPFATACSLARRRRLIQRAFGAGLQAPGSIALTIVAEPSPGGRSEPFNVLREAALAMPLHAAGYDIVVQLDHRSAACTCCGGPDDANFGRTRWPRAVSSQQPRYSPAA
jgi:hypothetical protein